MNLKVRRSFAVAAVGALACSFAFAQQASAAGGLTTADPGSSILVSTGSYQGRVSGIDRFGTAVAASQAYTGGESNAPFDHKTVLLANASSWTDALAATPLADVLNSTVLYTYSNTLESKTTDELKRLMGMGVNHVILLGGEAAISPAVATQLTTLGFTTVDRIGGANRYETAELLAAETVDYYENGTSALAQDRATLRNYAELEQKYQEALTAWESARAATVADADKLLAAQTALTDALSKYDALTAQLTGVPNNKVVVNGVTYYTQDLNHYINKVVALQNQYNDEVTVENYLASQRKTIATAKGISVDDVTWGDIASVNVQLSDGTSITTKAALATWLASQGVSVLTDSTKIADIEIQLETAETKTKADLNSWTNVVAAVTQRINDILAAKTLDATLAQQIAVAYKAVQTAQADVASAQTALTSAQTAEQTAMTALQEAINARPSETDWNNAKQSYQDDLAAAITAGKKYPAFLATGQNFPDALAAGPAATEDNGVVLLTAGSTMAPETAKYLSNNATEVAVGGPAAAAAPHASVSYIGSDRYQTATKLATAYFKDWQYVGLASGETAPDAVVGGALMANVDGPIVLTKKDSLPKVTADYLSYGITGPQLVIFGGPAAISNGVAAEAVQALNN